MLTPRELGRLAAHSINVNQKAGLQKQAFDPAKVLGMARKLIGQARSPGAARTIGTLGRQAKTPEMLQAQARKIIQERMVPRMDRATEALRAGKQILPRDVPAAFMRDPRLAPPMPAGVRPVTPRPIPTQRPSAAATPHRTVASTIPLAPADVAAIRAEEAAAARNIPRWSNSPPTALPVPTPPRALPVAAPPTALAAPPSSASRVPKALGAGLLGWAGLTGGNDAFNYLTGGWGVGDWNPSWYKGYAENAPISSFLAHPLQYWASQSAPHVYSRQQGRVLPGTEDWSKFDSDGYATGKVQLEPSPHVQYTLDNLRKAQEAARHLPGYKPPGAPAAPKAKFAPDYPSNLTYQPSSSVLNY